MRFNHRFKAAGLLSSFTFGNQKARTVRLMPFDCRLPTRGRQQYFLFYESVNIHAVNYNVKLIFGHIVFISPNLTVRLGVHSKAINNGKPCNHFKCPVCQISAKPSKHTTEAHTGEIRHCKRRVRRLFLFCRGNSQIPQSDTFVLSLRGECEHRRRLVAAKAYACLLLLGGRKPCTHLLSLKRK